MQFAEQKLNNVQGNNFYWPICQIMSRAMCLFVSYDVEFREKQIYKYYLWSI
jgi:hypothetical protein